VLLEVLKGRENTNFEAEETGDQTYLNLIFTTHLILIIISPLLSPVKILSLSVQEKCKRSIRVLG
jgi:hypothetical protein